MLVTIQTIEQAFTKSGAEYYKVKGVTGDGKETTKSVFDNLKEAWPLLKENATLDFTMEKKGQFWNVTEIKPVKIETQEGHTPEYPGSEEAHKELVKEAVKLGAKPQGDERVRSMACSYSKDLVVAGKIELKDLSKYADKFISYILNN